MYSQEIREVPVEISVTKGQPKPNKRLIKAATQSRAEDNDTLADETAPHSMDIDETFWIEEPGNPTSEKKVRRLYALR